MAQPIYCDAEGDRHAADILVTTLDRGDVSAWCGADFVGFCRAVVDGAEAGEREATDAAALARLSGSGDGRADVIVPIMAEPFSNVPVVPGVEAFPTSGDSSPEGTAPAEPPTAPAGGPPPSGPHSGASRRRATRPEPNLGAVGGPDEAGAVSR
jgi:hypothetical protein